MDKMLRVQKNKAAKQPRIKKKPVKVVYISNPMKVKTSASKFRALVQELTGQDADMPDPSKFMDIQSVGGSSGGGEEEEEEEEEVALPYEMKAMEEDDQNQVTRTPAAVVEYPRNNIEMSTRSESDLSFETFDDDSMFMPQMLESFPSGLLSSSASWYESTVHTEGLLKSFDAM